MVITGWDGTPSCWRCSSTVFAPATSEPARGLCPVSSSIPRMDTRDTTHLQKKVEILYTATVSITTTPTSDNYQFLSCGFDFTIEFGCTNCSPLNVGSFGIISQPWISWLVCVWCVCVCVCSTWDILGWRMSCAHDMISQRESHDIRTSDRKRADDYTIELPILAHTS